MADIQALLAALEVFSGAPDKASLDNANSWLQDFQHSPEAWSTCNVLLLSPEAPPAAKLFAAQTFRTKVVYDLQEMDSASLSALRDTLITALERFHAGPRTIIIQLCLAIAGLALQFPAWENPFQTMIDRFGTNPATVPALLQFLILLPEELNNSRLPVTDVEWDERTPKLLRNNGNKLLELLTLYVQASGVTPEIQNQAFICMRNWTAAQELKPVQVAATPLLTHAFEALASDQLFDAAVDVICEIIHETQEVEDNMPVIEIIVPRVIALKRLLLLAKNSDDADKVKGYARIFSEAGETYRMLILQHTDTFYPIVEAIGECSAYSDLDIVPITFPFWMRLAQILGKKSNIPSVLVDTYRTLVRVIVRHLHYPPDSTPLAGQEAEDFRSFRHVMGDTLKDCCLVLRTDTCLLATHDMLVAALARGNSWQEVEAPLFAMRSMGGELDPADNVAVPKIMDLIPSLPQHPRVRYAALLIVSRYTEWVNLHPEYIDFQLRYISAGFESGDSDVCGAAGQALRYLCQDCKQHLIDFLPTLHTFLNSTGAKLHQDERRSVYEAIAYVISAMPMERAGESLRTFALDILSQVHAVATKPTVATTEELQKVGDGLENLETMLKVMGSFGNDLPDACQNTCAEAWAVLNEFLTKYGSSYDLAERTIRVLRHGVSFFGDAGLPVAPSVVGRMSFAFEATGLPSYLWIAGKIVHFFGNEENEELRGSFQEVYERSTDKMVSLLQTKIPREIPDVLEDYLHVLIPLGDFAPEIFFRSSAFPLAFKVAMTAFSVVYTEILFAALELFRNILTHDCLDPPPVPPPNFPVYAAAIRGVVEKEGFELISYLVNGMAGDFPEEAMAHVVSIFRALAFLWPEQLPVWIAPVLQQVPVTKAPNQAKTAFLSELTSALGVRQFDKVKYAVLSFRRASRKAHERRGVRALDA